MIAFDKYRKAGAYHWRQASTHWRNREFNPLLVARYAALRRLVRSNATRVLDVGCGDGYLMHLLLAGGVQEVHGIDTDLTGVRLAQEQLARHVRRGRWSVAVAESTALPLADAIVDAVTFADVIEHLDAPEATLAEIARVLTRDGSLLVSTPNRQPGRVWDPLHVQEFTPETLHGLLARHFGDVRVTGCWPMHWCARWQGSAAWRRAIVWASRAGANPFWASADRPSIAQGQLLAVCRK